METTIYVRVYKTIKMGQFRKMYLFVLIILSSIDIARVLSVSLEHNEVLKQFESGGVSVAKLCSPSLAYFCNFLDGIPQNVVSNVIKLKRSSACDIAITGTTEVKSKDKMGYVVKVHQNPCINNYIILNNKCSRKRVGEHHSDLICKESSNNYYNFFDSHWNISFNRDDEYTEVVNF